MNLALPVKKLGGIGPKFAKKLERLDIKNLEDLIYHFPFRFEDYSKVLPISKCQIGKPVTIIATVWQVKKSFTRRGFAKFEAILADNTGTLNAIWFNQPYFANILTIGSTLQFSGKITVYKNRAVLVAPDFEEVGKNLNTARLVPVYPETDGVTSRWLRGKIATLLENRFLVSEFLPPKIVKQENFLDLGSAIYKIHFPNNFSDVEAAKKRLAFDEIFKITLSMLAKKGRIQTEKAIPLKVNKKIVNQFIANLPFKLTADQSRAIWEILNDLKKSYPTQRLLEGDVGCGKTVVVAAAILTAVANKTCAVILAPTEILAFQHFENLGKMLSPFNIRVGIFTKSKKDKDAQVLIGTHALLKDKLPIDPVSLVGIDEQHRFGVSQRTILTRKNRGLTPHLITMSATPIPRSLALTVFGNLDLTVISQMPAGRKPVKTYLVPPQKRQQAIEFVKKEIKVGHQAFMVFPIIAESETLQTVKAAKSEFEKLKLSSFEKIPIDLLHGRLKSAEKERVLKKFAQGVIKVLVSTAIVEVGIDVPAATVMIIEGAERFGLAQLHQLRGRVGRAKAQAYCFLFTESFSKTVRERMSALVQNNDGIRLAEVDLALRGPGEFFGTTQHGFGKLKLAKLTDLQLILKTRNWASKILQSDPTLEKFPKLAEFVQHSISREVTLS